MAAHHQAKAKQDHQVAHKKKQPTRQISTPSIQPPDLQEALDDPLAASPETILQLQQTYGNRAVSQVLAKAGQPAASAKSLAVTPVTGRDSTGTIQLKGGGSHGKTLYAKNITGTYTDSNNATQNINVTGEIELVGNVQGHPGHTDYSQMIKKQLKKLNYVPRDTPDGNITITDYSTFTRK